VRSLSKKAAVTALAAASVGNAVAAAVNAIPGWAVTDVVAVINYAIIITLLGGLPAKRAIAPKAERPLRKMLGHAIRRERELAGKDARISKLEADLGRSDEDCGKLITVVARQYDRIDRLETENDHLMAEIAELSQRNDR